LSHCSFTTGSILPDGTRTPADGCKSTFSCSRCQVLGSAVTDDATTTSRLILCPAAAATSAAADVWIPVSVACAGSSFLFANTSATVRAAVANTSDDCRAQSVDGSPQRNSLLQRRDAAAGAASGRHLLRTSWPAAADKCCPACEETKLSNSHRQSTGNCHL